MAIDRQEGRKGDSTAGARKQTCTPPPAHLELHGLLVRWQQQAAARFADAVQDRNDGLEVALVEDRQRQLQVPKVSGALCQVRLARFAL